jgi:hypothetical protein
MKTTILASMAALILAGWQSPAAVGQFAQMPSQSGMFGTRVLGQPLTPSRSAFGGGVQTNATGSFLYIGRTSGGTDFTAPWRHPYQSVLDQTVPALPAMQLTLSPQQPTTAAPAGSPSATPAPAVQVAPTAQPPVPGTNAPGASPAQGPGMTPNAPTMPGWSFATGQNDNRAAASVDTFTRSPELSDRLTRIARSRGMLVGPVIDVLVSGNVAMVQGKVRTQANRLLLGNIVGLEPDVSRIDNRLTVSGFAKP